MHSSRELRSSSFEIAVAGRPARLEDLFEGFGEHDRLGVVVSPDYYLFHVGRPLGDHGQLDVWPRHKEVVVEEEPQRILEAINDRPAGAPGGRRAGRDLPPHRPGRGDRAAELTVPRAN